jgi:NAD(P)-dependent dehydrogenase (short-subunit alcohol dehydrogenase family)
MDEPRNTRSMGTRLLAYLEQWFGALRRRRQYADLTGQVALVTGGSRGLGLLLARELANAGCKLALCARDEAELARAREIQATPAGQAQPNGTGVPGDAPPVLESEVLTLICDVTDRARIGEMVDRVVEHYGRIDILVNNAGIIQVTPVATAVRADFEQAMDPMFWGVHDLTMAVLPGMVERGYGRIVNITSIGGKISVPHLLPYSTAKFAATGFSEGLRAELAGKNVTVTTIVPGLMRTGSVVNVLAKGNKQAEVGWFSVLGSLPIVSMDASRAARQIVRAMRRGRAEEVVGLPAKLAVRAYALFPNLSAAILELVASMLPKPVPGQGMSSTLGRDVPGAFDRPMIRYLTLLSRKAAVRNNEVPGRR